MSKYWQVDEIRSAFIHGHDILIRDEPFEMLPHNKDGEGRVKFPAYLLTAHKKG